MTTAEKLQLIREEKKFSLRKIHRQIVSFFGPDKAIDYATIKRINAGLHKPTEFSLYQISLGLGTTVDELRSDDENAELGKIIRKNKPEGHYDYTPNNAVAYKFSTARLKNMLAQKLRITGKAKTCVEKTPGPEDNKMYQKWVYVLKGEITVVVKEVEFKLKKDDVFFFEAHNEHYFYNPTERMGWCIIIHNPPYL
jgi:mannose-6-phosphate isomerase-like protein (cupin superfamily)